MRVVDEGDGDVIEEGQTLSIQTTAVNGADGSELGDTYSTRPRRSSPTRTCSPSCTTRSSARRSASASCSPSRAERRGTNVVVGEVVEAKDTPKPLDGPEGEAVTPAAGLPTVTLDADGKPTVTPVAGDPPTTLVVQPLIKGTGAEVTADQTLTVNYSLFLWDGTPVESSFDSGEPATFALNARHPRLDRGPRPARPSAARCSWSSRRTRATATRPASPSRRTRR